MSHVSPIVFVVDDDISVRESLELLIRDAGWQPEIFESAQEFLSRPHVLVPSCLVLDVTLPGLNGLDLQKRVAVDRTDMPIIFITGHGDVPMTVQAMKAGAVEFLTKPFNDNALLTAIGQALERSRAALEHEAEIRGLRDCYASLSRREREVMALVVRGLLNKQVGFELGNAQIPIAIAVLVTSVTGAAGSASNDTVQGNAATPRWPSGRNGYNKNEASRPTSSGFLQSIESQQPKLISVGDPLLRPSRGRPIEWR
jgi:FixJ family two-component response regulator